MAMCSFFQDIFNMLQEKRRHHKNLIMTGDLNSAGCLFGSKRLKLRFTSYSISILMSSLDLMTYGGRRIQSKQYVHGDEEIRQAE